MAGELTVTTMILLIVSILVFGTGASLARLLTRDALFEGLRDRWRVHFLWRQEQAFDQMAAKFPPLREVSLAAYLAHQNKAGVPRQADSLTAEERRMAMLHEIGDRSEDEPVVPFWATGAYRANFRPWSRTSAKIIRIRGYMDFISCMWCAPVYIYGAVAAWTWWRVYQFDTTLSWTELTGAALPIDWLVLAVPLTLRWVYGIVASKLDS